MHHCARRRWELGAARPEAREGRGELSKDDYEELNVRVAESHTRGTGVYAPQSRTGDAPSRCLVSGRLRASPRPPAGRIAGRRIVIASE